MAGKRHGITVLFVICMNFEFDAVDKPTVTCQVNRTSVTLLCSGDDRPATQYRWEGPAIEPQPGPQLKIEAAETSDSVYTCVLNNPVSESRTELPVKSCFPAPVIVLIIIILIIIIAGFIYYKKCYKRGVEYRVKPHGDMMRPAQAHDEHQKAALAEQHRGADGRAALSQEESHTALLCLHLLLHPKQDMKRTPELS
ncbi:hypothetical protein COCON_G00056390 [Conger conger]|uniref:Ig-like domain-containing protein n=1 Tax=Conger conger TaxID=82655 RepID=A0A9Q1DWH8_CONCO|nr:hypothetical protein COCON_G00056390 [Conger conger]